MLCHILETLPWNLNFSIYFQQMDPTSNPFKQIRHIILVCIKDTIMLHWAVKKTVNLVGNLANYFFRMYKWTHFKQTVFIFFLPSLK